MLRGLGLWIVLEVMIGGVKFKAKEGIQRPWTASLHSCHPSPSLFKGNRQSLMSFVTLWSTCPLPPRARGRATAPVWALTDVFFTHGAAAGGNAGSGVSSTGSRGRLSRQPP